MVLLLALADLELLLKFLKIKLKSLADLAQPVALLSSYPSLHTVRLGAQLNVQLSLTFAEEKFLFGDCYSHALLLLMQCLHSFFKFRAALALLIDKFPNFGKLVLIHLFLSAT